jgi:hypothetical protein
MSDPLAVVIPVTVLCNTGSSESMGCPHSGQTRPDNRADCPLWGQYAPLTATAP